MQPFPLSPFRAPLRSLPFTLSPSSSLPPRARLSNVESFLLQPARTFPSSLSATTTMESNRFLLVAAAVQRQRRRRHSKTRTRRYIREREKKRERKRGRRETLPNSPSFGCTRAIVCNSTRESNRNSPLSWLPYALLFPFATGILLLCRRFLSATNCHRDSRSMETKFKKYDHIM